MTKPERKILLNIEKAQMLNDPTLFKKLGNDIWEFRTNFNGLQYRLLAFWDKRDNKNTLVITTHGFIKKRDAVPRKEIEKAQRPKTSIFKIKSPPIMPSLLWENHKTRHGKSRINIYSLDQIKNELIGPPGTVPREEYEFELNIELLGEMIRIAREKQNLTQEQLGKLIGVQKAQISKLERNTNNVTLDTVMRVFTALHAKVTFKVELPDENLHPV